MKNKIFSIFLLLLVVFLAIIGTLSISANTSGFNLYGKIINLENWKGGTIGNVQFLKDLDDDNFNSVYIDSKGKLHGHFWLGTAGWATFDHGKEGSEAKLNCPDNLLNSKIKDTTTSSKNNKICYASGYAWSQNAGWILLGEGDNKEAGDNKNEKVYFNTNSANLEGFAWSSGLGWIPMITSGLKTDNEVKVIEGYGNISGDDKRYKYPNSSVQVNFIGKVVVIGNYAGERVLTVENLYGYLNQEFNSPYKTVQHAILFNQIRGNVAQMVRNREILLKSLDNPSEIIYNQDKDYCFYNGDIENSLCNVKKQTEEADDIDISKLSNKKTIKKTIIVKGKDIIIDGDFVYDDIDQKNSTPENLKGIIALKGDNGEGGNIYITKNVDKIFAYMVAEGSIFSGEKGTDPLNNVYNSSTNNTFGVPDSQLYINGLVVSKNTIGGAVQGNVKIGCPVLTYNCDENNYQKYDFSYFRNNTRGENHLPQFRQNLLDKDNAQKLKHAIMVIDYNNNIISNPPPGFEIFK